MIFDCIKNAGTYAGLNQNIEWVLKVAREISAENFPKEPVVLDGTNVFINAACYDTQDTKEAVFEAHRKYVDVFVMVEGSETVYVKKTDMLKHITKSYDSSIDALLAQFDEDAFPVRMEPGDVLILFPQDAHAPGCHVGQGGSVKKLIGKVRIG